jgi:hypothetical protein
MSGFRHLASFLVTPEPVFMFGPVFQEPSILSSVNSDLKVNEAILSRKSKPSGFGHLQLVAEA